MTEQRPERMRALFEQAADLPPADQRAFLDATCPAEPDLRARVEHLLACDARLRATEGARGVLDSPLVRAPQAAPPSPATSATTEKYPGPVGARAAGPQAAATQAERGFARPRGKPARPAPGRGQTRRYDCAAPFRPGLPVQTVLRHVGS